MPILISLCLYLRLIIEDLFVINVIGLFGNASILTVILLFLLSYILQFCWYHTMFIKYIAAYMLSVFIVKYSITSLFVYNLLYYILVFAFPILLILLILHLLKII